MYGQCKPYGNQPWYNKIKNKIVPMLNQRKGWITVGYSNGMIIEMQRQQQLE